MKFKRSKIQPDTLGFYCPACKQGHTITDSWGFNGNLDSPTLRASVGVNMQNSPYHLPEVATCHSQITDGKISYYTDSTHEMSGKTIEIPDFPENYGFE